MPEDSRIAEEKREVIKKIRASDPFNKAPEASKLLEFLFKNRHRRLLARDIEAEHLGRPIGGQDNDPGHSRVQIVDLKDRLDRYNRKATGDKWRCELERR